MIKSGFKLMLLSSCVQLLQMSINGFSTSVLDEAETASLSCVTMMNIYYEYTTENHISYE